MKTIMIKGEKFTNNPRKITREQAKALKRDLDELGDLSGVVHDLESNQFVGGNQRTDAFDIKACQIEIVEELPEPDRQGTVAHGFIIWQGARYAYRQVRWTPEQCKKANIIANLAGGTWDFDILKTWDADKLAEWGFGDNMSKEWRDDLEALNLMLDAARQPNQTPEQAKKTLAERFGVHPFSVLDARQGYWQNRKRAWIGLGIQGGDGRGDHVETTTVVQTDWLKRGPDRGGSIFDPVLCELVYRWFNVSGGAVLDPFAGAATRGIVSAYIGCDYTGVELRQEQVSENYRQLESIRSDEKSENDNLVTIKISAASAREKWNGCQVDYILNTCHGRCCHVSDGSMHVPILKDEIHVIENEGGRVIDGMLQGKPGGGCAFQENGLCRLHLPGKKPLACNISPFTINDHDTLIVKNRNRKLICYKAEPSMMTYKAYKSSLVKMFGEVTAEEIEKRLDAGSGDFTVQMSIERYNAIRWITEKQRDSLGLEKKSGMFKRGVFTASPDWICGDSSNLKNLLPPGSMYDLIFTCPPYYDLEIYSEAEKDGSVFETYEKFIVWYRDVFKQAVDRLKDNRFLVVTIGEIRDKRSGAYQNFVGDNITCFRDLGLHYYNEMILVTAVGSLPLRAGRYFTASRKIGKTHQNVLVFYKGNLQAIKEEYSEDIEFGDLSNEEDQEQNNDT